ncbi:ammonia-dependent NAD(+) synthetase [Pantoea sp. Mhis]|uniref:ammonia-dependent NAD(+) synthetase n=1 Tax=Pantoea sp. Mhis TaxID=2576759 RepID=UPI00135802DC|nr:ammonia-dependent NAD(+) synthetase [Pantoea sp. Mhis]MXP56327.1 ammonia-dependent NAD(+) synthetase [Pantoea sp. Mhis]
MSLQQEIIHKLGVQSIINAQKEIRRSIDFLKNYLRNNLMLKTLVLGISGGQDSTLAGKLSQIAMCELRKETNDKDYTFIAVRLPYGIQIDEKDCENAIEFIKPDCVLVVNIKPAVLASEYSFKNAGIILSDIIRGNEKARERMKVQYTIANMYKGLVVGTGHAAEAVTGFYTKFGDGGSDINPLFRLNKRQGKQMLKTLKCPEHLYLKQPTADLEDIHPALPDESVLGITYNDIDDYLEGKKINELTSKILEDLYLKTEHKRRLPITIFDYI